MLTRLSMLLAHHFVCVSHLKAGAESATA